MLAPKPVHLSGPNDPDCPSYLVALMIQTARPSHPWLPQTQAAQVPEGRDCSLRSLSRLQGTLGAHSVHVPLSMGKVRKYLNAMLITMGLEM